MQGIVLKIPYFYKIFRLTQAQTIALYQPLLHHIAVKLLKCKADAEDIVQDTFLKWLTIDPNIIDNTKAYLVRAVTNNCLNHIKTLQRKKEEYFDGLQMPEFLHHFKELDFSHLDMKAEITAALHKVQAKLQPLERAVYLLREVFDIDYDVMQEVLEKKKDHCRQLFSRAKRKLAEADGEARYPATKPRFLDSFIDSCQLGTADQLIAELRRDTVK